MPKQRIKRRSRTTERGRRPAPPRESPASEAATIAWTLAASIVLLCDVATTLAHALAVHRPDERGPGLLRELLLFSAAVVGMIVIALTPVVFKLRRVPPPQGFTVFALCAAAAPLLALAARAAL